MSQPIKTLLPPVFLFEMIDHGYAIGKSLHQHGIKIVGFFPSNRSFEYFSRIPTKKYVTPTSNEGKLELLIKAAKAFDKRPVLITNNDAYFPFLFQYLPELSQHFSFELPDKKKLNQLLEKDLFNEFAKKHNIQIPVSIDLSNKEPISQNYFKHLKFPLVIKPKYRSAEWNAQYPSRKAFVTHSLEETVKVCSDILGVVDRLIVQEWIPGSDSNIYFCLTYITKEGQVLETFCGQKIHQHPILLGNTSSAIPTENEKLSNETLRILKLAGMKGFCSVEFKKHEDTGDFYVIEPTVGRIDRQQYVSSVSNKDVVLSAYCYLANIPPIKKRPTNDHIIYMEESLQLKSYLDYHYYKSSDRFKVRKLIKERKIKFMHLTYKDPVTSLLVIGGLIKHLLYYLVKGRTFQFHEDPMNHELMNHSPIKNKVYQEVVKTSV
jgi:predicted ATP-grasp superfamily ATP-dependent carboligase